jgi:hypothetical protein
MQSAWSNLQRMQVSTSLGVVNGQEYILNKVARGQDRFAPQKVGAVTVYGLRNEDGEISRVKSPVFTSFAKAVRAMDPEGRVRDAMEKADLGQHLPQIPTREPQPPKEPTPTQDQSKLNPYEAKQKARQERYARLAEKTRLRAQERLDQAKRMADIIPFGQPIHIGHYSEKSDRRFRDRIHQNYGKGFELLKQAEHYDRKAESVNSYAISADDPDAQRKLQERVEQLKAAQERMKAANAAIRAHQKDGPEKQREALEKLGFKPDQAENLMKPDVMGTVGFASYSLSNNNANIRRLEERIQVLEKAKALEDRETQYVWGSVRENKEVNRIQFRFDSRQGKEVTDLMKSSGFRWAPSESAWQRQWTGNAVYAAREVIKQLDEMTPPEQAVAAPEATQKIASATVARSPDVHSGMVARDPGAALVSAIRDRDGDWYNLSVQENNGRLVGALQRRDAKTSQVETLTPQDFRPGEQQKSVLVAKFAREGGDILAVRLSRGAEGGVDVVVFSPSKNGDVAAWQRIHEHPGRLRANESLQKTPDHQEGKTIEQALGVDPKMLNPAPAREAYKAPARLPEKKKQQGVGI